jgi:hypothetical protein
MQDKIDIATSSGVSGTLTHATLDTKNQVIRSHRPVSFVLPNGTIRANALTFYSAKHTLTFRGKVAVHMVRPKKEAETAKAAPATQNAAPQDVAPQDVAPQNVAPPPQKAEEPGEVILPPLPGEDGAVQGGAQGAAPSVP